MYLNYLKHYLRAFNFKIENQYQGRDLNDVKLASIQIVQIENQKVMAEINMQKTGLMQTYAPLPPAVLAKLIKFILDEPANRINNQPIKIGMNYCDYEIFHQMPLKIDNITKHTHEVPITKAQYHALNHILRHLKVGDEND